MAWESFALSSAAWTFLGRLMKPESWNPWAKRIAYGVALVVAIGGAGVGIHEQIEERAKSKKIEVIAALAAEGRGLIFDRQDKQGILSLGQEINHFFDWRKRTMQYLLNLGPRYVSEFDMGDEVGQTYLDEEVKRLEKIELDFK